MCFLCGPSWLHVGVKTLHIFYYTTNAKNTWPNQRRSITNKLWHVTKNGTWCNYNIRYFGAKKSWGNECFSCYSTTNFVKFLAWKTLQRFKYMLQKLHVIKNCIKKNFDMGKASLIPPLKLWWIAYYYSKIKFETLWTM